MTARFPNAPMVLTDSRPLDAEGLNYACLRATAAACAAEQGYAFAANQVSGTFLERRIRGLAEVQHAKADALCELLGRANRK